MRLALFLTFTLLALSACKAKDKPAATATGSDRVAKTTTPAGSGRATPEAGSGSSTSSASGSGTASASGSGTASASGLPTECDDYKAAIERLATCEKMSKGARETIVKAYAEASEGWKKLDDAAKKNIAVSCKAGADAVLGMGKTQCGW